MLFLCVLCSVPGIVKAQSNATRSKGAVLELIKLKPKCKVPAVNIHGRVNKITTFNTFFFSWLTVLVSLALLFKVPESHSNKPHYARLLWTSDRPVAETCK